MSASARSAQALKRIMAEQTYTPGEVSEMLSIPPSSLRRYVDVFRDYLSSEANRKRGRRFTSTDLAILARIRDLTAQGQKLDALSPHLADLAEQHPKADTDQLALQVISNRLDSFADMFKDQQSDINQLRSELEQLKQKKPWYKRLFG